MTTTVALHSLAIVWMGGHVAQPTFAEDGDVWVDSEEQMGPSCAQPEPAGDLVEYQHRLACVQGGLKVWAFVVIWESGRYCHRHWRTLHMCSPCHAID